MGIFSRRGFEFEPLVPLRDSPAHDAANLESLALERDAQIKTPHYGNLNSVVVTERSKGDRKFLLVEMAVQETGASKATKVFHFTDVLDDKSLLDAKREFEGLKVGEKISLGGRPAGYSSGHYHFEAARIARGFVPPSQLKSETATPEMVGDRAINAPEIVARREARKLEVNENTPVDHNWEVSAAEGSHSRRRPETGRTSVFDLVLNGTKSGELNMPVYRYGKDKSPPIQKGDRIRAGSPEYLHYEGSQFGEKRPSVVVEVDLVEKINLKKLSEVQLEELSRVTTIAVPHLQALVRMNEPGIEEMQLTRFRPVPGQEVLEGRPTFSQENQIAPRKINEMHDPGMLAQAMSAMGFER